MIKALLEVKNQSVVLKHHDLLFPTVDLELSDGEMVAWKPPEVKAGFHAYSLPNGYMIICPDVLEIGHAFEIIALCYTTLEGVAVRQITSYYDVQGQIVKLTEIIYQ